MNILISVLVPAYNEEKNIENCIKSIFDGCNESNVQVIVIDDGSTDRTLSNAEALRRRYRNLLIETQENGGVGSARNHALSLAKGKWIMFADADDGLPDGWFLNVEKYLHSDCKVIQGVLSTEGRQYVTSDVEKKIESAKVCNYLLNRKRYLVGDSFADNLVNSAHGVYGKLYARELIKDIQFAEQVPIGEDILFYLDVLQKVEQVLFVDSIFYNIHLNPVSSTRRYNKRILEGTSCFYEALTKRYVWKAEESELYSNSCFQVYWHFYCGVLTNLSRKNGLTIVEKLKILNHELTNKTLRIAVKYLYANKKKIRQLITKREAIYIMLIRYRLISIYVIFRSICR